MEVIGILLVVALVIFVIYKIISAHKPKPPKPPQPPPPPPPPDEEVVNLTISKESAGDVYVDGQNFGEGSFEFGLNTNVAIQARAEKNYHVVSYSIDGDVTRPEGSPQEITAGVLMDRDRTFHVQFRKNH